MANIIDAIKKYYPTVCSPSLSVGVLLHSNRLSMSRISALTAIQLHHSEILKKLKRKWLKEQRKIQKKERRRKDNQRKMERMKRRRVKKIC